MVAISYQNTTNNTCYGAMMKFSRHITCIFSCAVPSLQPIKCGSPRGSASYHSSVTVRREFRENVDKALHPVVHISSPGSR